MNLQNKKYDFVKNISQTEFVKLYVAFSNF